MKPLRQKSLPENIRLEIKRARLVHGWSQLKLGEKVGLSQRHISVIETGKIAPRYDTLIEILRVLELDLVLVPKALLPAVQALVRDYRNQEHKALFSDLSLYAADDDEQEHQPELGNE